MADEVVRNSRTGRFIKGHTGNPRGRPKGSSRETLRSAIFEEMSVKDMREIVQQAIRDAKGGNRHARRDLWEFTMGKPVALEDTSNANILALVQIMSGIVPNELPNDGADLLLDGSEYAPEEEEEVAEDGYTPGGDDLAVG